MKTKALFLILILTLSSNIFELSAQSLQVSPELKEFIELSLNKDRKVAEKGIDKQIAEVQQKADSSSQLWVFVGLIFFSMFSSRD